MHWCPSLGEADERDPGPAGLRDGSAPAYCRTADLYFDDLEALGAGFASEQGEATAADASVLAERTGSSLTFLVCALD